MSQIIEMENSKIRYTPTAGRERPDRESDGGGDDGGDCLPFALGFLALTDCRGSCSLDMLLGMVRVLVYNPPWISCGFECKIMLERADVQSYFSLFLCRSIHGRFDSNGQPLQGFEEPPVFGRQILVIRYLQHLGPFGNSL